MAKIQIGGISLDVKDYYCAEAGSSFQDRADEKYFQKNNPTLWLYVNVTDNCNASCKFCVNCNKRSIADTVNPMAFREALRMVAPHIFGISFTGGEPMLYPDLVEELIGITSETVPEDCEIDLATNGTNLQTLGQLRAFKRISSVHISRHHYRDEINTALMENNGPDSEELSAFINSLEDPGKIVLNCVLQKGGVENNNDVAQYLDYAIEMGVRNTSFISMFMANSYCEKHYVSAMKFPQMSDITCDSWNQKHAESQFQIWNRHSDHGYCHCLTGSYVNPHGITRFYFRCPEVDNRPNLCRQLVFTPQNRLQDGFGETRRVLWEQ